MFYHHFTQWTWWYFWGSTMTTLEQLPITNLWLFYAPFFSQDTFTSDFCSDVLLGCCYHQSCQKAAIFSGVAFFWRCCIAIIPKAMWIAFGPQGNLCLCSMFGLQQVAFCM
jgi:hypothetical protein